MISCATCVRLAPRILLYIVWLEYIHLFWCISTSECRSNRDWVQAENWEQQTWLLFIEATIIIVLFLRTISALSSSMPSFVFKWFVFFLLTLLQSLSFSFCLVLWHNNIFMSTIIYKYTKRENVREREKESEWISEAMEETECVSLLKFHYCDYFKMECASRHFCPIYYRYQNLSLIINIDVVYR